MTALVITGTDTDVGKTVFAAALTRALDGVYWKPIQSGTLEGADREIVRALSGLGEERIIPERYVLSEPLSPHRSAEIDGIEIDPVELLLPAKPLGGKPLIIEGAGGLMVPINREMLFIDIFQRWELPVVLCARTRLGTINHSLLSVEALRKREIPILGIAFIGEAIEDTERTICEFAGVKRLGRLPPLPALTPEALSEAFEAAFDRDDFLARSS